MKYDKRAKYYCNIVRRNRFRIILSILVSIYLYNLFLIQPQIFVDELYWYDWAGNSNFQDNFQPIIERGCVQEIFFRPLLRLYISFSYLLFDTNFYGYKLILLLVNVGSIFLAYKIGKLYRNEKCGLIFALLFTFLNPVAISSQFYFSRAHQVFEVFFILLSILLLKKISINPNKINISLFLFSSILAFLSRESSIILIPLFLYLFPLNKVLKRRLLKYLMVAIVPILLIDIFLLRMIILLIIFFVFIAPINPRKKLFITTATLTIPVVIGDQFFNFFLSAFPLVKYVITNGISVATQKVSMIFVNLPLLIPSLILLFVAAGFFIKLRRDKEMRAFAIFMLGCFLIPFFYSLSMGFPFPYEYFALSLIPALFVISDSLSVKRDFHRHYMFAILLVLFLLNILLVPQNNWYYSFKTYDIVHDNLFMLELTDGLELMGGPDIIDYQCNIKAIANIAKIDADRVMYLNELEVKKPPIFYLITYPWMMDTTSLKEKIESADYCEIDRNLYKRC